MSSEIAFNPSSDISFVIRNNSSIQRTIKVFNTKIGYGGSLDLMKVPGVTEEDIRTELTKGKLKTLLAGGSLVVASCTANFTTSDSTHGAFLKSIGINSDTAAAGALTQANWYIDAINGVDTNSGATTLTPLKTLAELTRRIGSGYPTLTGSPLSLGGMVGYFTTINIRSSIPKTDPLNLNVTTKIGSFITVIGTPTILLTGTVSTFVATDMATNVQATFNSADVADWALYVGKRIRMTSGSANNALFWVAKTNGAGNPCNVSQPGTNNYQFIPAAFNNTNAVPNNSVAPGNTFVIEDLPTLVWGNVDIRAQLGGNDTNATSASRLGVMNVDLTSYNGNSHDAAVCITAGNIFTIFNSCKFSSTIVDNAGTQVTNSNTGGFDAINYFVNCSFNSIGAASSGCNARFFKPVQFSAGMNLNGTIYIEMGSTASFITSFISYGSVSGLAPLVFHGSARASLLGVFDSLSHGILVGGRQTGLNGTFWASSNANASQGANIYGSNNDGYGIFVSSNCTFGYGNPSNQPAATAGANLKITGTQGNFALGGSTTAQSYNAGAGTYNAAVTCTWANLLTAGSLHNVDKNTHAILTADMTF
jgi:hypothetical protein